MTERYNIKYKIETEVKKAGFTIDDINTQAEGLADALILICINKTDKEGLFNQSYSCFDGGLLGKGIDEVVLYMHMLTIGEELMATSNLPIYIKEIIKKFTEEVKASRVKP